MMFKKTGVGGCLMASAIAGFMTTGSVEAQSVSAAEVAELRARIDRLEAAPAAGPALTFGLGSATTLTLYGFVRAEAFYDFDFDQGDLSNAAALGRGAVATDGAFNTSVRVSRLGVRVASETDIGTIGGQLEYDLFASNGTAELRLRHANITAGGFLLGQFWTNFMPIGQYPTTADFNGPIGITFARVPQIRYTHKVNDLSFSGSIEEAAWNSDDPVATLAGEFKNDRFSVRLAGIVGTVIEGGIEDDAYGLTLSGQVKPWEGGSFGATVVSGQGIGGLLIGGGNGLTTTGVANDVDGFTLELRQDIGEKFNVGLVFGREDYGNAGASNLSRLQTVHLNAFYRPTEKLALGAEYIRGERTDGAGTRLKADRVGLSATFSF